MINLLFLSATLLGWLLVSPLVQATEYPGAARPTLEFIENKGPWDARARYVAPLPSGRLFAETDGLTLALLADGGPAQRSHQGPPQHTGGRGSSARPRPDLAL